MGTTHVKEIYTDLAMKNKNSHADDLIKINVKADGLIANRTINMEFVVIALYSDQETMANIFNIINRYIQKLHYPINIKIHRLHPDSFTNTNYNMYIRSKNEDHIESCFRWARVSSVDRIWDVLLAIIHRLKLKQLTKNKWNLLNGIKSQQIDGEEIYKLIADYETFTSWIQSLCTSDGSVEHAAIEILKLLAENYATLEFNDDWNRTNNVNHGEKNHCCLE